MYRAFFDRVNDETLGQTISNALDKLDWQNKVRNDSTVFVKPNFTWPRFRPGVVTSPAFLAALLPLLKDRADRVMIGESDLPIFRTSMAFRGLGIDKVCRASGAEMVELSRTPFSTVETMVAGKKLRLSLPRVVLKEVDVMVNAAVPKCHVVTKMSGAMKNFYGLIPDPFRGNRHRHEVNYAIVGVNKIIKSDLVVMDGIYSLSGRGPILGTPIPTKVIIAADNALAADSVVCRFFEMDPLSIRHLRLAEKEGLGAIDEGQIQMVRPLSFRVRLRPRRALMDYFAILTFKSRFVNKMVMSSPLTPILYKLLGPFRSAQESLRYREDVGGLPTSQFRSEKTR